MEKTVNAYMSPHSVRAGDVISIRANVKELPLTVRIYRFGHQRTGPVWERTYAQVDPRVAEYSDILPPMDQNWNLPVLDTIETDPNTWVTGVYIAMFSTPLSGEDESVSYGDNKALFIVRPPVPTSPILLKVPYFTFQAYNDIGAGPSNYFYNGPGPHKLTLNRPGAGTNTGDPYEDVYDLSSSRQVFEHWALKWVTWLESQGYTPDFCSDLDIHYDTVGLSAYRVVLCVGHDEYWTEQQRSNVRNFVAKGGNLAIFSGNTCWWRVTLMDGGTSIWCNRDESGPHSQHWWVLHENGDPVEPENTLTGVSYRSGAGQWSGARQESGYTVQFPKHWVFESAGLDPNAPRFGYGPGEALIGYECDGAIIELDKNGKWVPTGDDSTPMNFMVLGVSDILHFAEDGNVTNERPDLPKRATMGLFNLGSGMVFNCATVDWARLLGRDAALSKITANVLDRFSVAAVTIAWEDLAGCGGRHWAVENTAIRFVADAGQLPGQIRYQWSVTGGASVPIGQATDNEMMVIEIGSPPMSVSLTVDVFSGNQLKASGSLTFFPLTANQAITAELRCSLIELASAAKEPHRLAIQGVGKGNRLLIDPLWDPLRDGAGPTLTKDHLGAVQRVGEAAAVLAGVNSEAEAGRIIILPGEHPLAGSFGDRVAEIGVQPIGGWGARLKKGVDKNGGA